MKPRSLGLRNVLPLAPVANFQCRLPKLAIHFALTGEFAPTSSPEKFEQIIKTGGQDM